MTERDGFEFADVISDVIHRRDASVDSHHLPLCCKTDCTTRETSHQNWCRMYKSIECITKPHFPFNYFCSFKFKFFHTPKNTKLRQNSTIHLEATIFEKMRKFWRKNRQNRTTRCHLERQFFFFRIAMFFLNRYFC